MRQLAEKVLGAIRDRELVQPGDRVAAAVSGGADSVALLYLLLQLRAELGIILSIAHVNYKLRGEESDQDEEFVAELARRHGLDLHVRALPMPSRKSGIEAEARRLRYEFFRQLMADGAISKVATGHTLDDQAETVLLRIVRGTGVRGLSGIHPRLRIEDSGGRLIGEVVRPLLATQRCELEPCLSGREWREDSTNRDPAFSRNRIRHYVLPLMKREFGAGVVENLANLAEIARAEEEHWQRDHAELRTSGEELAIKPLSNLSQAAQRRLVRSWIETQTPTSPPSFRLIDDILRFSGGPGGGKLEMPGGRMVRSRQNRLVIDPLTPEPAAADYEYQLRIPGKIDVPELDARIEAVVSDPATFPSSAKEEFLDPARLPENLTVRNWKPGDRFWPAHTKAARKVKELLSDLHLTGSQKKRWPVATAEGIGLVWMRGFPVPDALLAPDNSRQVLWIRDSTLP